MAENIGKIELNFQVVDSGDPKMLLVADFSKWRVIENMPAFLEITPPGFRKAKERNFKKEAINGYNTLSLGLSSHVDCEENTQDLPDGIYEFCLRGGKDGMYKKHKYYLKKDKFQLELDKLFVKLNIEYDVYDEKYLNTLYTIDALAKASSAATRLGKIPQAQNYFKSANKLLDSYKDCKDCI